MHEKRILPFETIVLRTPYYGWTNIEQINSNEDVVNKLLLNHEFMEAIMIASPSLYHQAIRMLNNELDEKRSSRILLSLYKYYTRMAKRCTPFGKFAGCSVLKFGEKTHVNRVTGDSFFKGKIRLDSLCSVRLSKKILNHPELRKHLRYRANTSLNLINDQLQYIEHRNEEGEFRYFSVSVENNSFLTAVLELASDYCHYDKLLAKVVSMDVSVEDASEFLNELIDEQILSSEIELNLTGSSHLDKMISFVGSVLKHYSDSEKYRDIHNIYNSLKTLSHLFEKYENENEDNERVLVLKEVQKLLAELNLIESEDPFVQVDSVFELEKSSMISKDIIEDINELYHVLNKIHLDNYEGHFKKFKEKFRKRYDDKPVPLVQCLDVETGIGYKESDLFDDITPLIDNIVTNGNLKEKLEKQDWTEFESLLLGKYIEFIQSDSNQIELNDVDIEPLNLGIYDMAQTFSVVLSMVNDNNKDLLLLNTISGSTASNLLGRFSHLNSEIDKLISTIQQFENELNENKLVTEIIHSPAEIRHNNILARNREFEYETPYLGNSLLPADKRIEVNDLVLQYSKFDKRLVLFSKKHQKEVIPRLSTAHNFATRNVSLYSFLCDMQFDGVKRFMSFNWGTLRSEFNRKPRVVYKNVILSLASWSLDNQKLRDCEIEYGRNNNINEWLKSNELPTIFNCIKRDNSLLIDASLPISLALFMNEIKSEEKIIIEEYLEPSKSIGSENEIIISFANNVKKQYRYQNKFEFNTSNNSSTYLGGEWIYFKIYCGIATSDEIINESIYPLIEKHIAKGEINSFFYIRFIDDDGYHLRLRLQKSNTFDFNLFFTSFNEVLSRHRNTGQISNVLMDSYSRETDRYGGVDLMKKSEDLFCYNSIVLIKVLRLTNIQSNGRTLRWLICLRLIDELLNALQFPVSNRLVIFEQLRASFFKEFDGTKETKKALDQNYRAFRNEIYSIMGATFGGELESINHYIHDYKISVSNQAKQIYTLINTSSITIEDFLISHIHMHINRCFVSQQRKHELAIYDILTRYYKTIINRNYEQKH